jgi:hypothetical protein
VVHVVIYALLRPIYFPNFVFHLSCFPFACRSCVLDKCCITDTDLFIEFLRVVESQWKNTVPVPGIPECYIFFLLFEVKRRINTVKYYYTSTRDLFVYCIIYIRGIYIWGYAFDHLWMLWGMRIQVWGIFTLGEFWQAQWIRGAFQQCWGSGSISQRYGSGSGSFPFLIKVLRGLK